MNRNDGDERALRADGARSGLSATHRKRQVKGAVIVGPRHGARSFPPQKARLRDRWKAVRTLMRGRHVIGVFVRSLSAHAASHSFTTQRNRLYVCLHLLATLEAQGLNLRSIDTVERLADRLAGWRQRPLLFVRTAPLPQPHGSWPVTLFARLVWGPVPVPAIAASDDRADCILCAEGLSLHQQDRIALHLIAHLLLEMGASPRMPHGQRAAPDARRQVMAPAVVYCEMHGSLGAWLSRLWRITRLSVSGIWGEAEEAEARARMLAALLARRLKDGDRARRRCAPPSCDVVSSGAKLDPEGWLDSGTGIGTHAAPSSRLAHDSRTLAPDPGQMVRRQSVMQIDAL